MASWEQLKTEGNELLNRGDSDGACAKYTAALELVPESSTHDRQILFSNRSAAQLKSHHLEEALQDAEICITLGPTWAKAYNRKASVLKELKRTEEAIACCDLGLQFEPTNAPLLALRKNLLTQEVVSKLSGVWHGSVAEEVGGYMQVFDFTSDSDVTVRVLGSVVSARYQLDVLASPFPHLDIHVPNSPGAALVRHIYKFSPSGDELILCSPYLRPPEERPTSFEGLGMVTMKRGDYVPTAEEEAFKLTMASKTPHERVVDFLKECIDAVPTIDVRPTESDSDEQIAVKLTANVKFQTFYQKCTERYGADTEAVVKEIMLGNAEPEAQEVAPLIIQFRIRMMTSGLIADDEPPAAAGSNEEATVQDRARFIQGADEPLEKPTAAVVVEPVVEKKKKKKTKKEEEPQPATTSSTSSSMLTGLVVASAVLGAVAVGAFFLLGPQRTNNNRQ